MEGNVNLNFLKELVNMTERDKQNLKKIREALTEEEVSKIAENFAKYIYSFEKYRKFKETFNIKEIIYEYLTTLFRENRPIFKERRKLAETFRELSINIPEFISLYGRLFELIREKLKEKFSAEELNEVCLSLVKYILVDISTLLKSIIQEDFEKFIKFFEINPDPIIVLDDDFRITFVNKTFEKTLKLKAKDIVGKPLEELFVDKYKYILYKACSEKKSGKLPEVLYLQNSQLGITKPFEVVYETISRDSKNYYILDLRDVTEEIKREKEKIKVSLLYTLISDLMKIILEETNKQEIFKKVVERFTAEGRYKYACIHLRDSRKNIVRSGEPGIYSICLNISSKEPYVFIISKDEEFYPAEVQIISNFLEEFAKVMDTFTFYERLKRISLYDPLTGLPVRNFFVGVLEDLINDARKKKEKVVVVAMDIDNFTTINSLYGYSIGDRVLKEVADRLKQVVRLDDFLARVGSDTFVVAFKTKKVSPAVNSLISRILAKFVNPIILNSHDIPITFSIGVAVFPDNEESSERLLADATQAMFEAKKLGGNTVVFYTKKSKEVEESFILRKELIKALENKEFILYFQPKISLKDKKIVGAEALIRWKKGDTLVPPYKFIPILEESGLINEVGLWVIEEACNRIRDWRKKGIDIEIAVNLSPVQLRSSKFISYIIQKLEEHPQEVRNFGVEITETAIMENISIVSVFLKSLTELGIKIYIDDFGTGYSSIAYLKNLPVYAIKIDVDFVKDIHEDQKDYEIVKTIINLAKSLNLKTVAEGVEREEHERILTKLGCNYAQGYYYSPPVPAEKFEEIYKKFTKKFSSEINKM